MAYEYVVFENCGNENFLMIASQGGFKTEEAAKAAGAEAANRIAASTKKVLSFDVHLSST